MIPNELSFVLTLRPCLVLELFSSDIRSMGAFSCGISSVLDLVLSHGLFLLSFLLVVYRFSPDSG
jgi:hypothetical protein